MLFEHGDEMSMARLKKAQCSADSVSSCANERAKKEAERRARQLETSQLGHQKGPGGGKPDLRSNPKKAEKRARKAAAKK
ncbi:hypothetical protein COU17_01290 [Candidatus Kaiserbacteria bacterium CG10_big_fil_rev_8_21_14_0_10_49_17]|uniref:Uncharacterized protein n=1 Tax=Candidatus Kaiserbacteria bacterium CG10_big_fil_rev_8_21_14_0_10_49_17 TaxID=1974609 RepID=A0A2M6WES4_9BACT|nr:MAG: hypothetical protein COU17_01290 [Candidatus Kaiserbacteria bacterium CG10_big_fil_rev_8_21_14_0_10_49_17]